MRKLDFPNLIVETDADLRTRERKEKDARLRLRVQLLRLLKSQAAISIKDACRVCGITPKHGYDLWKVYRQKGLNRYLQLNWKPLSVKTLGRATNKITSMTKINSKLIFYCSANTKLGKSENTHLYLSVR